MNATRCHGQARAHRPTWTATLGSSLGLLAFFPCAAQAANDYTRCVVPEATYQTDFGDYCIPRPGAAPVRPTYTVAPAASGLEGAPLVVSIPARNCRTATGNLQGDLVVLVDSSQSLEKTDPTDERLSGVSSFMDELAQTARTSSATEPQFGLVNYGGRLSLVRADDSGDPARDGKFKYNPSGVDAQGRPFAQDVAITELPCVNGDSISELNSVFNPSGTRPGFSDPFSSADATARWNERINSSDTYPLSLCEYLGLAGSRSTGVGRIPSFQRTQSFLRLPEGNPRGLTDMSYMLQATKRPGLLEASTALSKHVVVISDGLPVVRVRRPKSYCLEKDYLPNTDFEIDSDAPISGEEYCWDRNFREGVNAAHSTALTDFTQTNLHHILFWSVPNEAFIDFDDQGTLNPADFLIENSARTGNGKVKFKAATSAEALRSALSDVASAMDGASLQRVDITVTNQDGTLNPTYSAVSPLGPNANTSDPDEKRFDLKILYLKSGNNTVRADYVYADGTFTETFTVSVLGTAGATSNLQCAGASSNFTVDGDRKDYPYCLNRDARDVVPEPPAECTGANPPEECTCEAPEGDGFLPFPDASGNIRVYRNADPANQEFEGQDQFARVEDYGADDDALKAQDLRIQGGTGNCGVIAGLQTPTDRQRGAWVSLVILLLPALALGRMPRRKVGKKAVRVKGGRV